MGFIQSFRSVMLVLFAFHLLLLLPFLSEAAQFGIEVEFASEHLIEPREAEIPDSLYTLPLEFVKVAMKDSKGQIKLKQWDKRTNRYIRAAYYVDPKGREWQVTPESVNTIGYDGFEFITPPLEGPEDKTIFKQAIDQTIKSGKYGKGIRSSTHVTIDVSHLFSVDGDASRLVDTLLFIESHWPEIYAAVSPTRYGTLVNRFSVPLAAQHHELLNKLATLAPSERSYKNVKAIFENYHKAEVEMKDGNSFFAWKYRSANYRKLFQLDMKKMIPVIEFRILDYQKRPEDTIRLAELFVQIIEKGSQLQNGKVFNNPFPAQNYPFRRNVLNDIIYNSDPSRYETFLSELGFDPIQYPRFKHLQTPPKFELPEHEFDRALDSFNPNRPVLYQNQPITFGFEVEMKGPQVKEVVPDLNGAKVNLNRFPFLDGSVDLELTGNVEVRSKPTSILAQAIDQMKKISETVNTGIASYHLHMRIPMGLAQSIPQHQLQGWLSRIADAAYAWRLEYRDHEYALRAPTHKRRAPHLLDKKGTVTVKTIENTLDIEFRGFMNSISQIEHFAKIIIAGFLNPELIQGSTDFQSLLHFQEKSLLQTMTEFIQHYEQRDLTPEEIYLIEDLNEFATSNGNLPLFGFEYAPYLSQLDRIRVEDANFEFKYNVLNLLKDVTIKHKFQRQSEEFYSAFRSRIKRWGRSIRLYSLLERTLLFIPVNSNVILKDRNFIRKLLLASANPEVSYPISLAAKRILSTISNEVFFKALERALHGTDPILRRNSINLLTEIAIDQTTQEMERRKRAAEIVQKTIQDSFKAEVVLLH